MDSPLLSPPSLSRARVAAMVEATRQRRKPLVLASTQALLDSLPGTAAGRPFRRRRRRSRCASGPGAPLPQLLLLVVFRGRRRVRGGRLLRRPPLVRAPPARRRHRHAGKWTGPLPAPSRIKYPIISSQLDRYD